MTDLQAFEAALGAVEDPFLHRSLAALGMIRSVSSGRRGKAKAEIAIPIPDYPHREQLETAIQSVAKEHEQTIAMDIVLMSDEERTEMMGRIRPEKTMVGASGSATRVIGVASGKGGVGKSSITTNLAVTLAERGHSVAVVDADVWGFSIPQMLGVPTQPYVIAENLVPPEAHGVRVMSMDFFVESDQAVIWRGPMLHSAMEQFLRDVFWDEPEYLLIDMPPGTGDISISISQFLPRAQMLVVTTPQPAAQRVAKRAALMAEKVNQEVIGIVENMSWFTGDDGKRYELFGSGGGQALADEVGSELFAQIPLIPLLREGSDQGRPIVLVEPDGEAAAAFGRLADAVIAKKPRIRMHPELVIK